VRRAIRIALWTALLVGAFVVGATWGDDKPVPDALGIKIRDAQLEQTRAQAQQMQIVQQYQQLQSTLQDDTKKLQALKDQALKEAGLDPKEWTVDEEHLTFVKLAAPPEPPKVAPTTGGKP